MAPKTAEKKVAGKAVAQKKGGKKGGKKRSIESWKIYIYKVCCPCCLLTTCRLLLLMPLRPLYTCTLCCCASTPLF